MAMVDKKSLSERDICSKYITPAVLDAGWDLHAQIREEWAFTDGRLLFKGKHVGRGKRKRADYLLFWKPNIPIAVIEAKDNNHGVSDGMQQALDYADSLQVPFVFSSNGDAFQFHDRTGLAEPVERQLALADFPSPSDLWMRYCHWKGLEDPEQQVVAQDYFDDGSGKTPRYYQWNAINRTVEAIAQNQDRILLVMATGTGKTYTAFQIIWRLWKAGAKKRILFLADRNILVDQTKVNDFKPFGSAMTKVTNRTVDKSYEIYLSLYQAVTGSEEERNIYKQFSPDFFDLVIVDECHRGSARLDSNWHEILKYFSSATHIGLTATPKETCDVSNMDYFGEPIYTYSLRKGIADGFLAPYKVIRVHLDKDLTGWRPEKGKCDKNGQEIDDRVYNQRDWDRNIVMEKRVEIVARKVTEFLKSTDPYAKTIVFCENVDHAERMRVELVNQNTEEVAKDRRYVMRITGDDKEGKAQLSYFIDPESKYPVIAVTSKLMTTGVDAQTCKLIVLDQRIESMTEFKQTIGRGTRINEEYGKTHFTIMDFRNATDLFADPKFDGDPVQIYQPGEDDDIVPPDIDSDEPDGSNPDDGEWPDEDDSIDDPPDFPPGGEFPPGPSPRPQKCIVNDVEFWVAVEQVQHIDKDGKLVTESLRDYTRRAVREDFASLKDFLNRWNAADRKAAIVEELEENGVFLDALADDVGKDYDPFDLVCHIAFDQPPLTRHERANNVRKRNYFTKYGEQARQVLEALLDKYADQGVLAIEQMEVLRVPPVDVFGTPIEIVRLFGGKDEFLRAIRELEQALYAEAA